MMASSSHRPAWWRSAASMLMLYAGKTSGVIVNLIFLPIYSVAMGPDSFGFVAIILSLQALLVMLDFGMSTIVGREIAANDSQTSELLRLIFSAELGLALIYALLLVAATALTVGGAQLGMSPFLIPALVLLFMLSVLQNLYYNSMIARRAYVAASGVQLVSNLVRAGGTAAALMYVSPTVTVFVLAQLVGVFVQFIAAKALCMREFNSNPFRLRLRPSKALLQHAISLLYKSKPIALSTLAGAAVTQLDKPIISFFVSPASVAPYFLALTYCMVPMVVLAGPLAQFFQPLVINSLSAEGQRAASPVIRRFTLALLAVTLIPSVVLYWFRETLVGQWLHQGPLVSATLDYIQVLLPGLTVGALGYLPYTMLVATRDYKFLATLSSVLTVVTLISMSVGAYQHSVLWVCVICASYHASSTLFQWGRAMNSPDTKDHAYMSAKITFVALVLIFPVFLLT